MIQRVQSLFLLGVVIIAAALFFIPLAEKSFVSGTTNAQSTHTLHLNSVTLTGDGVNDTWISNNYLLMILNLLILAASVYNIFLYKNRPAQMRLCSLSGLIAAVLLVMVFYYSEEMEPATSKAHYLAGVYMIAAQVFLLLAARRSIRKDEMLVRAADRIR